MDHNSDAPLLSVVSAEFRLGEPAERAPHDWHAALGSLLGWIGIETRFVPAPRARRLPTMSEWGRPGRRGRSGAAIPLFAPWTSWCPTAFQNGGRPGLPPAQFVASYCLGHDCAADIMLISPHPSTCTAEQSHLDALPRAGIMRAMIRAALAEGRERIAILVHARHRAAVRRLRLVEDRRLCPEGTRLEVLAMEEALPVLMAAPAPWDAIVAMPDLRGIVFTMLAETTGVRGAWPMLWHAAGLKLVTSEAPEDEACAAAGKGAGKGEAHLPLDAAVLVHALALTLREAGHEASARLLHDAWSRLRDSGAATARRGDDGRGVTRVPETELIAILCRNAEASQPAQTPWRALKNQPRSVFGNRMPGLRIVSSNLASS